MLDQLKKDFLCFQNECINLRNTFNTYLALYESEDERVDVALRHTAGFFFQDLNDWLIQSIILQIGRLTDPARTGGRANLSVCWIVEEVGNVGRLTPRIDALGAEIMRYRENYIDKARNKYISHSDVESFRSSQKYGEHSSSEAHEFFEKLQEFTDEVGNAVGVGPLDYRFQPGAGDVQDLIRILKRQINRN
ncbi:hypothetical protein [Roseovarius sp. MBR-6]|jgi:hypothetical protein|uniref:AbiU2 domain-containing protein n=1 Tax=Roseovarius sp. MBR-6 TaxID=3156459 RepID=UPI003392CF8B